MVNTATRLSVPSQQNQGTPTRQKHCSESGFEQLRSNFTDGIPISETGNLLPLLEDFPNSLETPSFIRFHYKANPIVLSMEKVVKYL
jgi:hypothetical protein